MKGVTCKIKVCLGHALDGLDLQCHEMFFQTLHHIASHCGSILVSHCDNLYVSGAQLSQY